MGAVVLQIQTRLPSRAGRVLFPAMSTLAEIEQAVGMLPGAQQKALLQRLAKRFGGEGASCYDLARELFEQPGQLGASGRRDLSTNKAHLADFGRSTLLPRSQTLEVVPIRWTWLGRRTWFR